METATLQSFVSNTSEHHSNGLVPQGPVLHAFRSCSSCRSVPAAHKVLIFKAVLNEALLAALEGRPIGCSECHTLKQARGRLLRRFFGIRGFGEVRRRVQLSTVASELTVRRLMWLRASLLAEACGHTRLELAALVGACDKLANAVDLRSGLPTQKAPRFLHSLFSDLSCVVPCLLASQHNGNKISFVCQW